jgi:hypothetical protein
MMRCDVPCRATPTFLVMKGKAVHSQHSGVAESKLREVVNSALGVEQVESAETNAAGS